MSVADLVGKRFGRLVVLGQEPKARRQKWRCICDCGTEKIVVGYHLQSGHTTSCGCFRYEQVSDAAKSRGKPNFCSPEGTAWRHMIDRCSNPDHESYKNYGGRGITVCAAWLADFTNFYTDMGPRPTDEHTIERIDNNGPYTPSNCRWATRSEQAKNTRKNHYIEFDGERFTISDWSRRLGISVGTLLYRLRHWPLEQAVTLPPRARNRWSCR